jgi:hypothetical protein
MSPIKAINTEYTTTLVFFLNNVCTITDKKKPEQIKTAKEQKWYTNHTVHSWYDFHCTIFWYYTLNCKFLRKENVRAQLKTAERLTKHSMIS